MKVLLLGATGLLGHNVLQRLTATGHQVVAVVRRHGASLFLPDEARPLVTVIEGDITVPQTVVDAARGCKAIINCAGVTDMSLLHLKDYENVNFKLCRSIVTAMNSHCIKRLVHVSTVNTIGYGDVDHPADEREPVKAPFDKSYYASSKRFGEEIVLDAAADRPDWHVVVINPGFMLGPMDEKPSSGRMLLLAYRRALMVAPPGGKAFVDVRDVATATVNALTKGCNGERYIAVNSREHHTIKELYKMQAEVMGYRQAVVVLPVGLLRLVGRMGDLMRRRGVRTELSSCNVQQLCVREYYDNSRAVKELAMPETPIRQSIRDFHKWRNEK